MFAKLIWFRSWGGRRRTNEIHISYPPR
jgi:hypothetical protein